MYVPKSCINTNYHNQITSCINNPSFFIDLTDSVFSPIINTNYYNITIGIQTLNNNIIVNHIKKRYSEILSFYNSLSPLLSKNKISITFPEKCLFHTHYNMSNRLSHLKTFFSQLYTIPNISNYPSFKSFFDILH